MMCAGLGLELAVGRRSEQRSRGNLEDASVCMGEGGKETKGDKKYKSVLRRLPKNRLFRHSTSNNCSSALIIPKGNGEKYFTK